ncbi:MAG: hypothetical protein HY820_04925 [Acidobacteria bacterium]|nr:hypothetical protein [Acidobacteriota bacterium]
MFSLLLLLISAASAQVRPVDLEAINRQTAQRLHDGEWDHIIYYVLQSTRFTNLPPIEPALSAKAWKEAGSIPHVVARRMSAFLTAKPATERHTAMRSMVQTAGQLRAQYERAMQFLYDKEWAPRSKLGAALRDHVAALYQTRGHSSDTNLSATYGVHTGLTVIRSMAPPNSIRRVLLIGPGLDWSPRTALNEDAPPQSYQPYALADSLVRLGLARTTSLRIDCVDVNPRVVDHINTFAQGARQLLLRYPRIDDDWNAYFDGLGKATGKRTGDTLEAGKAAAASIRALRMNILTERTAAASYDLAVATNVLLYFDDHQLGLAMANTAHALRAGGFFLHNELRPAIEQWSRELDLPTVHARTVRIDPTRELHDGVVIHRR